MLNKDITTYSSIFSKHYSELRVQENRSINITLLNGDVVSNDCSSKSGVSSRTFKNGNWGFSSSPNISDNAIESVISSSVDNVNFLTKRDDRVCGILLPEASISNEFDYTSKNDKNDQKYWIEYLKDLDEYIKSKYPKVTSRTLVLSALDMEKNLLTATGSTSFSMTPRSHLIIVLTAELKGSSIRLMDAHGGLGQLQDNFSNPNEYYKKIDEQVKQLMDKVNGVHAKAGRKEVVLDGDLAGILAHEAIGHTTEADLVLGGSVAGDNINNKVASKLISLVDYANSAFGKICPVPVFVDDEGVESKDVKIIENGILKSFMHNKDSSRHFNAKLTGNARAFSFADEPLIRMRNTAILPGDSKLMDMISSVEDGYYLTKTGNGQADSTSEFMFAVTMGYEIKNGKLGRAIFDTTISGIAFDMLKTVSMVSDEMKWESAGMCRKKQPIPVGMGGPAIKCEINIGGR